jgi:hypothetical protein
MVHRCVIKSEEMWLCILVVSLLMCVCRTVKKKKKKSHITFHSAKSYSSHTITEAWTSCSLCCDINNQLNTVELSIFKTQNLDYPHFNGAICHLISLL